jgi:hypothetical protein
MRTPATGAVVTDADVDSAPPVPEAPAAELAFALELVLKLERVP